MAESQVVPSHNGSNKQAEEKKARDASLARHKAQCTVCKHPACQDIEFQFINWISPDVLADACGLSYDAIIRHAHALGLFEKRQHNFRRLLERGIEHINFCRLNNSQAISLAKLYVKINMAEQAAEKTQAANLKKAFERIAPTEREACAQDGSVPACLPATNSELADASPEGEKGGQDPGNDLVQ
jgi:hypothetical protein